MPEMTGEVVRAELFRRCKSREAVAEYFKAHPAEWVDAPTLMEIGGMLAFRTRVSECRQQPLCMYIENKVEREFNLDGSLEVRSSYRYLPSGTPIGPPAHEYRESSLLNFDPEGVTRR